MGLIYWDGRILEDEKEDDQLGAKASELKVEFDKMGKKHPLILDVRLPIRKNSTPYHIRFLDVNKILGCYDTDLVKPRESNLHSLTCRTTSLANIPINLRSSEVFVESLRYCRRTKSVGDLGELFVEYASGVTGSGDVMVSPSARFIFDSVSRTVMARSLVKNSIFFRLGTLDGITAPFRAASFSTSPMKTSGFTRSPVGVCNSLLKGPNSEATSPGSQISNLKASDRSPVSCSSTNYSTSSCKSSSSPPCLAVSKGLLYFAWKNGSLNILFKEGDDSGKVYAANFLKVESSVGKAMDYLYIIRSKTRNEAAQFVGMVKVFSSLTLDLNGSKSVETEFVLFGVENPSREVQHSTSSSTKNKGLSKNMAKRLFRSNPSLKHKATSKIDEPSFQIETFFQDPAFIDESKLADRLENGFGPSLELAAVVVRSSPPCREKEAETGGWGLKFLEKVTVDLHSEIHEEGDRLENSGTSWMSLDVLIPAGRHGGPTTGDSGPSTLAERWRSGGRCDCGGWDIGCPLTVLHDKKSVVREEAFPYKMVDLFIQGAKHGEPALKMVTTSEGMYTVYFQPTLSPLQVFFVGVAVIHAQTPALYQKL